MGLAATGATDLDDRGAASPVEGLRDWEACSRAIVARPRALPQPPPLLWPGGRPLPHCKAPITTFAAATHKASMGATRGRAAAAASPWGRRRGLHGRAWGGWGGPASEFHAAANECSRRRLPHGDPATTSTGSSTVARPKVRALPSGGCGATYATYNAPRIHTGRGPCRWWVCLVLAPRPTDTTPWAWAVGGREPTCSGIRRLYLHASGLLGSAALRLQASRADGLSEAPPPQDHWPGGRFPSRITEGSSAPHPRKRHWWKGCLQVWQLTATAGPPPPSGRRGRCAPASPCQGHLQRSRHAATGKEIGMRGVVPPRARSDACGAAR